MFLSLLILIFTTLSSIPPPKKVGVYCLLQNNVYMYNLYYKMFLKFPMCSLIFFSLLIFKLPFSLPR